MGHDAVLEFEYGDSERAHTIEQSIRPEIGDIDGDRTRVSLERDRTKLTVTISASDLVALRAGANTWSTLVSVAERSSYRQG